MVYNVGAPVLSCRVGLERPHWTCLKVRMIAVQRSAVKYGVRRVRRPWTSFYRYWNHETWDFYGMVDSLALSANVMFRAMIIETTEAEERRPMINSRPARPARQDSTFPIGGNAAAMLSGGTGTRSPLAHVTKSLGATIRSHWNFEKLGIQQATTSLDKLRQATTSHNKLPSCQAVSRGC